MAWAGFMAELIKWLTVTGLAALKVVPALGLAISLKMNRWEIFVALAAGSFMGVSFFTLFGLRIRGWLKERRDRKGIRKPMNYRKARKWKRMWLRFGLVGIALLTPPVISPPVGAIISVIFEKRRSRILLCMGASILAWSVVFAFLGEQILRLLHG
jgi:hypothetical protein